MKLEKSDVDIQLTRQPVLEIAVDVVAVGVFEDAPLAGAAAAVDAALKGAIAKLIERKEFGAKAYETVPLLVPVGKAKQVLVVGLGKREKFDAGMAYRCAAAASRVLSG